MKRVLQVGASACARRTFSTDDIRAYSQLTGDQNSAYATSVPAALLGGMFSDLLGTELPGPGTNWMKQHLAFAKKARVGEPLTATVEIVRLRPDKQLVNLRTVCINARGEVICDGEALVMAREMAV